MQRSRSQQVEEARPGAGTIARRGVVMLVVVGAVVGGGALAIRFAREPRVDAECASRYARAKTATDTTVVDAIAVQRKTASFKLCGAQRAAVERGMRI